MPTWWSGFLGRVTGSSQNWPKSFLNLKFGNSLGLMCKSYQATAHVIEISLIRHTPELVWMKSICDHCKIETKTRWQGEMYATILVFGHWGQSAYHLTGLDKLYQQIPYIWCWLHGVLLTTLRQSLKSSCLPAQVDSQLKIIRILVRIGFWNVHHNHQRFRKQNLSADHLLWIVHTRFLSVL